MAKFERLKLPSHGLMPGVAFAASDTRSCCGGVGLVLFGGTRKGPSNELWILDPAGEGWMQLQSAGTAPGPRTQSTLSTIPTADEDKSLLLFGGFGLNLGELNEAWLLELPDDMLAGDGATWQLLSPAGHPPPPRYGHSATVVDENLVVIGGQDGKQQFNDVWLLSTSAPWRWAEMRCTGAVPPPRTRHSATRVHGNKLLVFGGFSREARYLSDMYLLSTAGEAGEWTQISYSSPVPFPARAQHAAAASSDECNVFVFGGYDGSGGKNLQDLWLISVADEKAVPVKCSNPPEPRSRHSMHLIGEKLHVVGGYDGSKVHPGDVFAAEVSDPAGLMRANAEEEKAREEQRLDEAEDPDED